MSDTVHPFPGLRPFRDDESFLFFGRDEPIDELLRRLREQRFLAVVGTSGSGKSSLVRAGLLPALYGGFMAEIGSAWQVAEMRPGGDPIAQLAAALRRAEIFEGGSEATSPDELNAADFTETTLRRGPLGLIEAVQHGRLGPDENLLVLVDQFEELFRFERLGEAGHADDSAAFVKLLLEAAKGSLPIYVVLTMRSDFLGDCARFRDLPTAIDAGQYLIPRLTRDQLRQAIVGPAAVGGAEVTSRLVQRLLAEVGDDPDQLPVLQHALMRAWDLRIASEQENEPLDLPHYLATGGLSEALSRHADQAYEELDVRGRWVAELLFRRITEMHDQRGVRRPTRLGEICEVAQATPDEVRQVIEVFHRPGRSFLMPPVGEPLDVETPIDISHESLMRVWARVGEWIEQENASAMRYRRLSESARLYEEGESALMRDPELASTLEWKTREHPNGTWAARYDDGFERAETFLKTSRRSQRRRRFWRRLVISLLLLTPFMGLGWSAREKIQAQQEKIQELEKQKADLLARQQALETENVERSGTLTQLREQRQQLMLEVDDLQLANATLLVRLAELKQEISRLEEQTRQLRQENSELENSVAAEKEQLRERQKELADLPEKIRQLQLEVEKLKRQRKLLEADAEALGVQIVDSDGSTRSGDFTSRGDDPPPPPPPPNQADSERLAREVRELQERLQALQEERSALIHETAELEQEIQRLEEQREALREERQNLQEEVAKLKQAKRKRQRAVDQLLEHQESLRQALEALRAERTTLESQLRRFKAERSALSREGSRLRSENRLLEDYLATEKALQSALRSLTETDPETAARLALTAYRELEDKRAERAEIPLALFSSLQKLDPSLAEQTISGLTTDGRVLGESIEFNGWTEDRIREPLLRAEDLAAAICQRLPQLTSVNGVRLCGFSV